MPKIVDHAARRTEIIEAVWSLIVRKGFLAVTMRELAAEAGYANGALARYFPDKESVLRAAFQRAFDATNVRARAAIGDRGGLTALRLLCLEIMPLDAVRLAEARVVIGFWDYAAGQPPLVGFYDAAMETWRQEMCMFLGQARAAGEVTTDRPDDRIIDTVLALTMGLQINACFSPRYNTPERQTAVLDDFLAGLRSPRATDGRTHAHRLFDLGDETAASAVRVPGQTRTRSTPPEAAHCFQPHPLTT
jgi:AcrR family transcriptional regulator